MQLFASLLAVLALSHSALAGVYITSPVGTTVGTGGQVLTVSWADDGKSPSVASIGPCTIDLYTGSMNQQTQLQNFAANVDVSKASSVSATINPSVGQSGTYYFVRFTSLSFKDSNNPQYPYEAFSAKFNINAMTGTFNATVLAQIAATNATTSASSAVGSALASVTGSSSSAASTSKSASSSATGTAAAAAATTSKSAAMPHLAAPGLLVAALVGVAGYAAL